RTDSLWELRKLMRQQDEGQQQHEQRFNEDINSWTHDLEQMGINFVAFIEQCRPLGSHCSQRHVQRHLRSLRRSCNELRGRLDTLEIKYLGKISEEQLLMPTLRAVRLVLQQYDAELKVINAEAYKLVEQ
ncbi:hypothetical protein KR215_007757, partial [Drosophila sulfurigaster]